MSDTSPHDVDRAFRILIGVIAGIVVLGIVLLVVVVLVYRTPPGRSLAPAGHTPATQTAQPSAP